MSKIVKEVRLIAVSRGGRPDLILTRYDHERGGRVMEAVLFFPGTSGDDPEQLPGEHPALAAGEEAESAECERDALRKALEVVERGLDSLARYRHEAGHPFPYGAILGLQSIARHALVQEWSSAEPVTPSPRRRNDP